MFNSWRGVQRHAVLWLQRGAPRLEAGPRVDPHCAALRCGCLQVSLHLMMAAKEDLMALQDEGAVTKYLQKEVPRWPPQKLQASDRRLPHVLLSPPCTAAALHCLAAGGEQVPVGF